MENEPKPRPSALDLIRERAEQKSTKKQQLRDDVIFVLDLLNEVKEERDEADARAFRADEELKKLDNDYAQLLDEHTQLQKASLSTGGAPNL